MALETKVILALLAQSIGKSTTTREAYNCVVKAANVEGLNLPSYDEFLQELEEDRRID